MAIIPESAFKSVVSIHYLMKNEKGEDVYPCLGTGFFYGYLLKMVNEEEGEYAVYLVTNKHILEVFLDNGGIQKRIYIAVNKDSNIEYPYIDIFDNNGNLNFIVSEEADIAISRINYNKLDTEKYESSFIKSNSQTAVIQQLVELDVQEGCSVFIMGFPAGIISYDKKYVIVKHGTIARIKECIEKTTNEILIDSYIVQGNSGSPVILKPDFTHIVGTKPIEKSSLIGIVCGYKPYQDQNTGLAVIVPMDFVNNLIEAEIKKRGGHAPL